jgi:hypothetical protein
MILEVVMILMILEVVMILMILEVVMIKVRHFRSVYELNPFYKLMLVLGHNLR